MTVHSLVTDYGLATKDHSLTINTTGLIMNPDIIEYGNYLEFAPPSYDIDTWVIGDIDGMMFWEQYASELAAVLKILMDGAVKLIGMTLNTFSDTPNENGYYELVAQQNVNFKVPGDASLTAGGLTGQYLEFKSYGLGTLATGGTTRAYTVASNRVFGVSGLVNGMGDFIAENETAGTPGNRAKSLSDVLSWIERVSFSKKKNLWDWVILSKPASIHKHNNDNRAYAKFSY